MGFTLETVSGKIIDPENLRPEDIDVHDIAWSLSRIARFAGHTITAIPYNVAQHSIFVADMMIEDGYNFAHFGLLHDSAEYALGDLPSPVKKIPALREVIVPIEDKLLETIYTCLIGRNITDEENKIVKYYDKKAQFIEAHAFMSSRGLSWPNREDYNITLIDLQRFEEPMSSIDAYKKFIDKYEELEGL
jgi:5'-deoxynucleotidase YfbR-like HD superfamily hydrolase